MRHHLSAVIAASILVLPAMSFAAQADGPRAMERVVQQNDNYQSNNAQQSIDANREHKAAPFSREGNSAYGPTSNGNVDGSGVRRTKSAFNQPLYSHH
ncbi:hypothetical protein LJR029_002377 [Caballeronia sp. LjRoot29]|uniref:hypothetical protein n=1 Tax=Caballeronia sp. LjRoot29 TaxID=3342315 RepID=UPI003ED02CEA